jgi:hypothetical protein
VVNVLLNQARSLERLALAALVDAAPASPMRLYDKGSSGAYLHAAHMLRREANDDFSEALKDPVFLRMMNAEKRGVS